MEKKKNNEQFSYDEYLKKYFPKDTKAKKSDSSLFDFNLDVSDKTFSKIKKLLEEQKIAQTG